MADTEFMTARAASMLSPVCVQARNLDVIIGDISQLPDEASHVQKYVEGLSAILQNIEHTLTKSRVTADHDALVNALQGYLNDCQGPMAELESILEPLSATGRSKRSILRVFRRSRSREIDHLRLELREGKASLTLVAVALTGVLEKRMEGEVRTETRKLFNLLSAEFTDPFIADQTLDKILKCIPNAEADLKKPPALDDAPNSTALIVSAVEPDDPPPSYSFSIDDEANGPRKVTTIGEAIATKDWVGLRRLAERKKNLNKRTKDGQTGLHLAARHNEIDAAIILVDCGANLNARDNQLKTPIQLALEYDSLAVAALLVEKGCFLTNFIYERTTWELIERADELPDLPSLLRALGERLKKSEHGPFLLHWAISYDNSKAIEMLLDAGFDANRADDYGLPPLLHAVAAGRRPAMRILVERGADVSACLHQNLRSLLGKGKMGTHKAIAEYCENDVNALRMAIKRCDLDATALLLENGADPNFVFPTDGTTVLFDVLITGRHHLLMLLLEHGTKVNHTARDGQNPFTCIARENANHHSVADLVRYGGNINLADFQGRTGLHVAVQEGNELMLKALLESGADQSIKMKNGETAIALARRENKENIANIIKAEELKKT